MGACLPCTPVALACVSLKSCPGHWRAPWSYGWAKNWLSLQNPNSWCLPCSHGYGTHPPRLKPSPWRLVSTLKLGFGQEIGSVCKTLTAGSCPAGTAARLAHFGQTVCPATSGHPRARVCMKNCLSLLHADAPGKGKSNLTRPTHMGNTAHICRDTLARERQSRLSGLPSRATLPLLPRHSC